MRHLIPALLSILFVAACAPGSSANESIQNATRHKMHATADAPAVTAAPAIDDSAYLGRWVGVEGMYLVVARSAVAGRYALEMQWDLDHRGTFTGTYAPDGTGIGFMRDGRTHTLRRTDGAATGLKYLDGKRDCLTVAPREGYCRT